MTVVDPTARVASGAVLGNDVFVGPYCVIGPHVVIGDSVRLVAHVHVAGHTSIGRARLFIRSHRSALRPISIKYKGGPTRLIVGTIAIFAKTSR
jgi:UDP-N-acetylglucosamine acyltransferase